MPRKISRLVLLSCVLFSTSIAQEQPVSATAEDFEAVHGEWTRLDGLLDEVIEAYRAADATERKALIAKYEDLASQSRLLLPRLRQAAVASFKVQPNQNKAVTETLIGLVANDVRQDQYEAALELAQPLLDSDVDDPALQVFVGVAAYCLDNFEAAEVHLMKAEAGESLTQTAAGALQDLPTAKAAWAREQELRAAEAKADDLPRVRMETSKGTMVIELYENEAPGAVGNFVSLVEAGFYNGLTFHRVLPGFMAQGGCPDGTGAGGPGYNIPCECEQENHRNHFRGSLSMAHAGRNTGGSQFFLTFKRTAHLDGKHTVFGRVIEGLDVLTALQRRDPNKPGQPAPDKIIKAEVIRKRNHDYQPVMINP